MGDERYSISGTSNSSGLYSDEEDGDDAYDYFHAAAAALKPSYVQTSSQKSTDASSKGSNSTISDDALPDVKSTPVMPDKHERILDILASDDNNVDETVVFGEAPAPSPKRSSKSHRANQEYYDVLEMASSRLRQDSLGHKNELEMVSRGSSDEAVIKRKKSKRRKKKSKKGKRKNKHLNNKSEDEQEDVDGARRSAVFRSLFPVSMMERGSLRTKYTSSFSEKDLAAGVSGDDNDSDDENDVDPNDDLPTTRRRSGQWNPAALVTAAQSKMSDGRIDKRGFYRSMMGRADSAYETVQIIVTKKDGDIPNDFNLQSIGKSRKKYEKLQKCDSIVWGDESVLSASTAGGKKDEEEEEEAPENEETEMVDDCVYSELNEASENYLVNEQLVKRLMWQRDRRRLSIICSGALIFFGICLGFYFTGYGRRNESPLQPPSNSTMPNADEFERNDPPPRPLPLSPPPAPIGGFSQTTLHKVTSTELQYIVNEITPDASILSNPHSPQSKAVEWCKTDIKTHHVEDPSRVAQRYVLATLYYSTNGTGWTTNKNWGDGHECEWYGVGCETGENDVVSVTYLDLNSNNLKGTIPQEIGYISSLEQSEYHFEISV